MLPMEVIRARQFDQLRKNPTIVGYLMHTIPPEGLTLYRDGGEGWTFLEALCHLRDYETVFLERARLIVTQDYPDIPHPDPDQLAAERRYNEQDPESVYADWLERRKQFLAYLDGLKDEEWECAGRDARRGRYTVNDVLIAASWHDTNHIEQMARILGEKRTA
jgi:hypothetical protein